jgi:aspartate aminotransferase-like enzyme/phosphatidylglycerophosphate synthase
MLDSARPSHPVLYKPFYFASGKLAEAWGIRTLSPNVVTITWGLLQIGSGVVLANNRPLISFLIACLAVLLDCLDGDLARSQNRTSASGTLLEQAVHWVGNMFIVAAAGIGVFRLNPALGSVYLLALLCVTHAVYLATIIRVDNIAFSAAQSSKWMTILYRVVKFNYWLMPIELPFLFVLVVTGLNVSILWGFTVFFALSALTILVPQFFVYEIIDKKNWSDRGSADFPNKSMIAGKATQNDLTVSASGYLPEEPRYPPQVTSLFPKRCSQPTLAQVVELQDKLKAFFNTTGYVFLSARPFENIFQELGVLSDPDSEILVVGSSPSAKIWEKIVTQCGGKLCVLPVPFGKSLDLHEIAKALKERKVGSVVIQLSDSYDGSLNPVKEVGELVAETKTTRLIVDARLGLGVDELQMDAWGIDIAISQSNSGLMSPRGINLVAINVSKHHAVHRSASQYFSCQAEVDLLQPHVFAALCISTEMLLAEGVVKFLAHRREVAAGFRKGVQDVLGYTLVPEYPSAACTVFVVNSPVLAESIQMEMYKEYSKEICMGQTPDKQGVLRIGHAGWVFRDDIIGVIESIALSRTRILYRSES